MLVTSTSQTLSGIEGAERSCFEFNLAQYTMAAILDQIQTGTFINELYYRGVHFVYIVSSVSEDTLLHIQYMLLFAPVFRSIAWWRDC